MKESSKKTTYSTKKINIMKFYRGISLESAFQSVEIETEITASRGLKYPVQLPVNLPTFQPRLTAQWSVVDGKLVCKWLSV